MKIYITRQSAFSIQCGGLDRLSVWFAKPHYVKKWRTNVEDDCIWLTLSDLHGRCFEGWTVEDTGRGYGVNSPMSFGKLFGYADENCEYPDLPLMVWDKLKQHFGNTEFLVWDKYEKENKECSVENFLLEIDISFKVNNGKD